MWSTIFTIIASFVGVWAVFKYILLIEMRIDANTFKTLYDLCKNQKKIILHEEFVIDSRHPNIFSAFCFFKGSPWFYIDRNERLMQAGYHGKDHVTMITCFRWNYNKLKDYLNLKLKEMQLHSLGVPVELMLPWSTDKIGSLKEDPKEPIIDDYLWKDFDKEVAEVVNNSRKKSSALLYGLPGNGKTSFIKYLAIKYRLPVMIFTLDPDWNNHDLLLIFSQIPKKCIVLFEDFDNYFDKRKCIMGSEANRNIKFTFDIILNGLDGVYNTYEKVVFIMTVNDISKVDSAIKNRPSRFKFTRCFGNPSFEVRCKLLPKDWAEKSNGLNLDQIFRLKEYFENSFSFEEAISMLEKDFNKEDIEKVAHDRFLKRQQLGIINTSEDDWSFALEKLRGE
jgi:hypothetical protein